MVGPGDQSTFVEATVAVDASGTQYGLQLIVEENDVPTTVFVEIPGIEAPIRGITDPNLQIALDVDLSLGAETIAARVRYIDDGVFTNWVSTSAVSLPADVKSAILGNYNNAGALTGAVGVGRHRRAIERLHRQHHKSTFKCIAIYIPNRHLHPRTLGSGEWLGNVA